MANDTIVHAINNADRFCNDVLLFCSDFGRDFGLTYGEVLTGVTILAVFMIGLYNVLLLLSLFRSKLKKYIIITYVAAHALIVLCVLFILFLIAMKARSDAELEIPFVSTEEIIVK